MQTKVINIFGGPGTGKSTVACGVFHDMKVAGYNVELVTEYAKTVVWEQRTHLFEDQCYIFAKQLRSLTRLMGKVEYIVTDSPLILSAIYAPINYYPSFTKLLFEVWDSFHNINFVLPRSTNYQEVGRTQTERQAKSIDDSVLNMLHDRVIEYVPIVLIDDARDTILQTIKDLN